MPELPQPPHVNQLQKVEGKEMIRPTSIELQKGQQFLQDPNLVLALDDTWSDVYRNSNEDRQRYLIEDVTDIDVVQALHRLGKLVDTWKQENNPEHANAIAKVQELLEAGLKSVLARRSEKEKVLFYDDETTLSAIKRLKVIVDELDHKSSLIAFSRYTDVPQNELIIAGFFWGTSLERVKEMSPQKYNGIRESLAGTAIEHFTDAEEFYASMAATRRPNNGPQPESGHIKKITGTLFDGAEKAGFKVAIARTINLAAISAYDDVARLEHGSFEKFYVHFLKTLRDDKDGKPRLFFFFPLTPEVQHMIDEVIVEEYNKFVAPNPEARKLTEEETPLLYYHADAAHQIMMARGLKKQPILRIPGESKEDQEAQTTLFHHYIVDTLPSLTKTEQDIALEMEQKPKKKRNEAQEAHILEQKRLEIAASNALTEQKAQEEAAAIKQRLKARKVLAQAEVEHANILRELGQEPKEPFTPKTDQELIPHALEQAPKELVDTDPKKAVEFV